MSFLLCASNFTLVKSTEPGKVQSIIWHWHAPVESQKHIYKLYDGTQEGQLQESKLLWKNPDYYIICSEENPPGVLFIKLAYEPNRI